MRISTVVVLSLCVIVTSACSQREPNYDERAYNWAAVTSKSIEPCKKISESAITKYTFNPAGYKTKSLRSLCFHGVAQATRNKELCKFAVPVSRLRVFFLDGSKQSPENCRKSIDAKQGVVANLLPGQSVQLMAKLQYSNNYILNKCVNHFSEQRLKIDDLKSELLQKYNACISNGTHVKNSLKKEQSVYNNFDNRKKICEQREHVPATIKNHYFGEADSQYYKRRYGFCEEICIIDGFTASCQSSNNASMSEDVYIKFLETQARYGDLLSRMKEMKNY